MVERQRISGKAITALEGGLWLGGLWIEPDICVQDRSSYVRPNPLKCQVNFDPPTKELEVRTVRDEPLTSTGLVQQRYDHRAESSEQDIGDSVGNGIAEHGHGASALFLQYGERARIGLRPGEGAQ